MLRELMTQQHRMLFFSTRLSQKQGPDYEEAEPNTELGPTQQLWSRHRRQGHE